MVRLVVFVWLGAAFVVGATGVLRQSPVPPPVIALALTIAALLVIRLSPRARQAVHELGPGPLVLFHVVRIAAGAYFLVLGSRGVLTTEFTTFAGWGDIIVGVTAIWVLFRCLPMRTAWHRFALLAWNVAGLLDILGVLGNATRIFVREPSFVEPFMTLPLAILPTFVVPIVIVSHVLLFSWARGPEARRST
ncbi:MAG TPA: hypothetical protein VM846_04225 [Vicinamibacterales bacterium]|nr:hypothetical protein [Vicinamibacterales bacterium]